MTLTIDLIFQNINEKRREKEQRKRRNKKREEIKEMVCLKDTFISL